MPRDNPSFGGNGTIKCHACGKPTNTHRIGPCPSLRTNLIYASPLRASKNARAMEQKQRERAKTKAKVVSDE